MKTLLNISGKRAFLSVVLIAAYCFAASRALAQCSTATPPAYSNSCTSDYYTNVSASGTGVTSTIGVTGSSCTGITYFNYYTTQGVTASLGNTVNMFVVRSAVTYTAWLSVYVDWNNNGIYEASELASSVLLFTSIATTYSFTIPSSGPVTNTNLHMRLMLSELSTGAPCSANWGQTCDFYLYINCPPPAISVTPPSGSFCSGSAGIGLTASGAGTGGTYSWAPASGLSATTGAAVTATPAGTTIYTVTGTNTAGCNATSTATVTVNPLPAVIAGPSSVCAASSITLSDATAGGTWTSSNTGVATINPATGVLYGVIPGSTTVTYTLSGTGCSITAPVTVNVQPIPVTGTSALCMGSSSFLSDSPAGGTWMVSNTAIATINPATGAVSSVSVGSTPITYTLGSCSSYGTVVVNPLPTGISGTTTICAGSATTLSDGTSGGTWISGNTAIATIDHTSGVAGGVSAGSVPITYMLSTGCMATTTITVTALPVPISGSSSVCVNATTTLSDSPAGGVWSSGNTAVATITGSTGIVSGVSSGSDPVTYTLGICSVTATITVNPLPSGITGALNVCTGATTNLSDPTALGTWSSATSSVATVGPSSGVVTGVSAGTDVISYTLPTGCYTATVVTVSTTPVPITGSTAVCVNAATSLSDSPAGGAWSSGSTTVATITPATGIVSGVAAGTALVTYSLGSCSTATTVTVNPLPQPVTGNTVICNGASTTLSDATLGGTWGSASGNVGVGISTGNVTGIAAGPATITYTLASTGCYMTTTFTVNPLPSVITGNTGVCIGAVTALSDVTAGGTWSSSNTAVAPVTSGGVVSGQAVGSADITYTLGTGCFVSTPVTVNPLPQAITGPGTVCPSFAVTLSDPTAGGTWSSSPGSVATIAAGSGVLTGVAGGTADITYSLGTGCIATATVLVYPRPAAVVTPVGSTTVCPGNTVTLNANTGSGLSYQWYDGPLYTGVTTGTYIASSTGAYKVLVTDGNGCINLSAPVVVTIDTPVAVITVVGGSTSGCANVGIVLDANTGTGLIYEWHLNGGIITGAAGASYTATVTGNYTVKVTNTTGCSVLSNVVSLTLNPAPPGNVTVSGPATFCQNDSVTLIADPGLTYQWHSTGGVITGATNSAYTAKTSGNYWVTETNSYGCSTSSPVSVIDVLPAPNVGITYSSSNVFCFGSSVTLNAVYVAGYSYQWYLNGIAISGANSSSYTTSMAGNYRVQVTNNTTGCSDETHADTVVTVISTPYITPLTPTSFCWGGSTMLAVSVSVSSPYILYQWYYNGILIPGANTSSYNASAPGVYSCNVNIIGSCNTTTTGVLVTEHPLPNPVVTFDGNYFHTQTYYTGYQWYKNLIIIPGANGPSAICTGNGDYKVEVTDTFGCHAMSAEYPLSGWTGPTAVTNIAAGQIKIWPNPAQTMLHINAPETVHAIITGVDGKMVIDRQAAKDVDISHLADGLYMITLYNNNGERLLVQKIIKE